MEARVVFQTRHFQLFADYFQFCLQDESAEGNLGGSWTDEAVARLLALAPGTIGVGTVRNMDVPVDLELRDSPPDDDLSMWDLVNECSIEVPSGRIVVAGCTDYFPDAAWIEVPPGAYRARVYYGGLSAVSEDGLDGDDHYKIVLWPSPCEDIRTLRQREQVTEGRKQERPETYQ
jgi:hypothetical protein